MEVSPAIGCAHPSFCMYKIVKQSTGVGRYLEHFIKKKSSNTKDNSHPKEGLT